MTPFEIITMVSGVGIGFALLYIFEPYSRFIDAYLNFKPFNCVLCTSFWASGLVYYFMDLSILYAVFSAFIAEMAYRKLVN
jgi:hypothetical protein